MNSGRIASNISDETGHQTIKHPICNLKVKFAKMPISLVSFLDSNVLEGKDKHQCETNFHS